MSTLRIKAYGLTHTQNERNADNFYYNGNFLTNAREEKYAFDEEFSANIQVFAISDAGAKAKDRDIAARNGELVMSRISALQVDMESANQVDKVKIWDALDAANDCVISRAHQNDMEMQVSFSGLFFQGNRVFAAHVGDTRIYCIRDHSIAQLSLDNLAINELFSRGVISQEKLDLHKKNSQLSAYIGMDGLEEIKATLFTKYFLFQPGDMFLLCSDGITDTFKKDEMEELVKGMAGLNPAHILSLMSKRAEERNDDDYTMILLSVEEVGDNSRTEPASSGMIYRAKYETPAEDKPLFVENDDNALPDDMGDTKPMQAVRDISEEPKTPQAPLPETDSEVHQFDPHAFAQNLMSTPEPEPDDDFDDEDDEEDNRFRKPIIAVCIVLGVIVFGILVAIGIRALVKNNQDNESSVPVTSQADSEPVSAVDSEPEGESESESAEESETESVSESTEDSEEESEPQEELLTTYTVKSGDSWWGIVSKYYGASFCKNEYYAALKDYNGLSQSVVLKAGMVLKLPAKDILKILAKDWA